MITSTSCTVSILSASWLLTSHSCLATADLDPAHWVIFGGPSGPDATKQGTQIRMVEAIVPHPRSSRGKHLEEQDLALVRLQEPLVFSDRVSAVCLAEEEVEEVQVCVTAGWSSSGEGLSFRQYLTSSPLVDQRTCNSSTLSSVLCAEEEDGECREDGGAPLLCLSSTSWSLAGVRSRPGCGGKVARPGRYSDVVSARQWVLDTMGRHTTRDGTLGEGRPRAL